MAVFAQHVYQPGHHAAEIHKTGNDAAFESVQRMLAGYGDQERDEADPRQKVKVKRRVKEYKKYPGGPGKEISAGNL